MMETTEFDRGNFFGSFGQVWKKVITDPQGFFTTMPLTGGLGNPLAFAVGCLLIAGLGMLLTGRGRLAFLVIIWGTARLFIGAGLLFLISRHVFDGKGDYEATFRATAYASAPVVFLWVPLVRALTVLYGVYLLFLGLRRAQEFDSVKAVLTVLLAALAGVIFSSLFGGPRRLWSLL